jgi:5-formyltetrahydrofolate cyclo-ligase
LVADKRALRADMLARRERAHADAGDSAGTQLRDRVLGAVASELKQAHCVSAYYPVGSEIDPLPLYAALLARGLIGGLPVVAGKGKPLLFRRWRPGEALVPGVLGIGVPPNDAPEVEPDLLLVPLLAFDRRGYRLGYGGGFYDRTLEALRARGKVLAVGVGFAVQEVASVPSGPGDRRLDWLATEREAWPVGA